MNKIMITIGLLSGLNYQTDGTRVDYTEKIKLAQSIDHIQDMKEWMQEDINNDNIITDLGEFYIGHLDEVENRLLLFSNANNIQTIDFECDGYEVKEDGTVVNFYDELQTKYDN